MNYSKKNLQNTNFNKSPQITSNTFDFISKNISRYKKSKAQTKKFLNYVDKLPKEVVENSYLSDNIIESVNSCGSFLEFRNYFEVDQTKLHKANYCKKDKLCPACAMRRASLQIKKVYDYFEDTPKLKEKHWYYIVLPVKHNASESFTTVFNRARSGLQSLRKSINNSRQRNTQESFFSQFDGLMYSFEVTKTKNGWNNHINLLCCTDTPVTGIYKKGKTTIHNGIMEDWSKYTDNNSYVHSINKIDVNTKDELVKNLMEIFKYSLKFQDLKNDDLFEVYNNTYKKRLLGSFGSLYGIKTDVNLDSEEVLGKEFIEIVYRYNFKTKEYFEHSRQLKKVDLFSKDLLKQIKEDNKETSISNFEKKFKKVKRKNKYIPVTVFSSGGLIDKKFNLPIYKNFADYDIFKETMKGLDNI